MSADVTPASVAAEVAALIHEYGRIRGDLVEQYARDQLADKILAIFAAENAELRAAQARIWDEGYDAAAWRSYRATDISIGRADEADPPNPYRALLNPIETFEDELDAHIAESMKDPEYRDAVVPTERTETDG